MGCDIHLAVEIRNDRGRWKRVLPPEEAREPWLVEAAKAEGFSGEWARNRVLVEWYTERCYALFAMLADVRNGPGAFTSGGRFAPMCQPKGLPSDLSAEVRAIADGTGAEGDIDLGDHSQSWLTLAELDAYDWQRATTSEGVVTLAMFAEREAGRATGQPEEWAGGVAGTSVVLLSEIDARMRLRAGGIAVADDQNFYVSTSWTVTYADAAGRFYSDVLPALRRLGPPDRVRIVFGFDS